MKVEVFVCLGDLDFREADDIHFLPHKVVDDCLGFVEEGSTGLHIEMGNLQATFQKRACILGCSGQIVGGSLVFFDYGVSQFCLSVVGHYSI